MPTTRAPQHDAGVPTLHAAVHKLHGFGDRLSLLEFQREGSRQWSFQQLNQIAGRFAAGLQSRNLGKGTRVAILAPASGPWIAACLGVLQAGAVPVPVDVQLSDEALSHVLRDSDPHLVLAAERELDRLSRLPNLPRVQRLTLRWSEPDRDSDPDLQAPASSRREVGEAQRPEPEAARRQAENSRQAGNSRQADDSPPAGDWRQWFASEPPGPMDIDPDETAVLFYTSGTTGPPKGVPLSHRNIGDQLAFLHHAGLVRDSDRVLLPLPLHHVYPFVVGMLAPLTRGIPVVLPYSLSGPRIIQALRDGQVRILIGVPRLYRALADGIEDRIRSRPWPLRLGLQSLLRLSGWLRRRAGWRVGRQLLAPLHNRFGPHLRTAACGGAPLDDALAWRLESLGWQVAVGYGLTETSPLLTLNRPGASKIGTVGKPIDHVEIRIASLSELPDSGDSQEQRASHAEGEGSQIGELGGAGEQGGSGEQGGAGEQAEAGIGEVLVRGPGVFSGYRNLPGKTEDSLTREGWFRTGDLGILDDEGYLRITGRKGTMIVTAGGEKVQPDELEQVYSEPDAVREIGILSDQDRLVALVVPQRGAGQEDDLTQQLRETLRSRAEGLASYQRLHEIRLTRDSLPRTRLGKLQRHKLRQRYEQAKQGPAEDAGTPVSVEDMASRDRSLLDNPDARKAWELLAERYADQRLTPDSHLRLDLDLDSLDWIDLSLAIRRKSGVELDEQAMGSVETVRELLEEVAAASGRGQRLVDPASLEQPEQALSDRQGKYLEPLGRLQRWLSWAMFHLNRWLLRSVFRLQVEGVDQLPDAPCVIAPNHASYLDAPAIAAALPGDRWPDTYWGGWTGTMFANPLMKLISRLGHVVPVDPRNAALSSLAFGSAVLARQQSLVWFPEGERSRDGRLGSFRPGIAYLLQSHPVAVVPTVVEGTFEALPLGKRLPRPRKIRVRFGHPVSVEQLAEGTGQTDPSPQALAESLRDMVQVMQQGATAEPDHASRGP